MRALRGVIVLVLALALSTPVFAAHLRAALEAYGRGDYATAIKELRPLAEQGDALAQVTLGGMYQLGEGVRQDYVEATKWYRLAAEQGDGNGQVNLSNMLGSGLTPDYVEAHMWASLAAEDSALEGIAVQDFIRDWALSNREAFEGKMTPEQIAEAQRLAREWKPK